MIKIFLTLFEFNNDFKMEKEEILFVIRPEYKRTEIAFEDDEWQCIKNLDAIKIVSTAAPTG